LTGTNVPGSLSKSEAIISGTNQLERHEYKIPLPVLAHNFVSPIQTHPIATYVLPLDMDALNLPMMLLPGEAIRPLGRRSSCLVLKDKEMKPAPNCFPKLQRKVHFTDKLATKVVELGKDDEENDVFWYSKRDIRSFRSSAKALADRVRIRQPSLVQEVVDAYEAAKQRAESQRGGQLEHEIETTSLYNKWSKLGSSRRGLEKWVFPEKERMAKMEEVRASRSIVLNLQCLLQRGGAVNQEEMLRCQYVQLSRPALIVAQQIAQADEIAAIKYYKSVCEDDEDVCDEDSGSIAPQSLSSFSSGSSVSSLSPKNSACNSRGRSGRKTVKRRDSILSNKSKSSSKRSSEEKSVSSSAVPRRRASKSPLRRLQESICRTA